jgi:hypothetical protein
MAFLLHLGLEHLQSGVRLVPTEAEQAIRFDSDGPTLFIASSEAPFSAEWREGCLIFNIDAYEAEYAEPLALRSDRITELLNSNARLQRVEVPGEVA